MTVVVTPTAGNDLGVYAVPQPASNCNADPPICASTGGDEWVNSNAETAMVQNDADTALPVFLIIDAIDAFQGGPFTMDISFHQ
jgi:hypothetical protein